MISCKSSKKNREKHSMTTVDYVVTFVSYVYMLAIVTYVVYSFFVDYKPILCTDLYLLTLTSAFMQSLKSRTHDHYGTLFVLTSLMSALVIGVVIVVWLRDSGKDVNDLYSGSINIAWGALRRVIAEEPASYTFTWWDYRMVMYIPSIVYEAMSLIVNAYWFLFVPKNVDPSEYHDVDKVDLYDYYIQGIGIEPYVRRIVHPILFVATSFFILLLFRLVYAVYSVVTELPYWTKAETPSAVLYCGVFWVFLSYMTRKLDIYFVNGNKREEFVVLNNETKKKKKKGTELRSSDILSEKFTRESLIVSGICEYRTRTTSWYFNIMFILVVGLGCLIHMLAFIDDSNMVRGSGTDFLNILDYEFKLYSGSSMGWYYYDIITEGGVVSMFGRMTFISQMLTIIELVFGCGLFLLLLAEQCNMMSGVSSLVSV